MLTEQKIQIDGEDVLVLATERDSTTYYMVGYDFYNNWINRIEWSSDSAKAYRFKSEFGRKKTWDQLKFALVARTGSVREAFDPRHSAWDENGKSLASHGEIVTG